MAELQPDSVAMSMLAMAETLRLVPKVKMAIKCIRGASLLQLSPAVGAHVQFQLGKLLFLYTENVDEARATLENTYNRMSELGDYFMRSRLEIVCMLCESYLHGANRTPSDLVKVMEMVRRDLAAASTKEMSMIQHKFFLYYIEAAVGLRQTEQATEACTMAIKTVSGQDNIVESYFRITKSLVTIRLTDTTIDDAEITEIANLINTIDSQNPAVNNLRLYFICTQLAFMVSQGKTKSSKQHLRQMQADVQAGCSQGGEGPQGIRWMEQTPVTVFACLMTVVNSVLQLNYDRATKYYSLGMRRVLEYTAKAVHQPCEYGMLRSVERMRLALNEMMAQLNIMACKPRHAMENIRDMVLHTKNIPILFQEAEPVIQNLLGFYCMHLWEPELAEQHFEAAANTRSWQTDRDTWALANVNLGITYLVQCKRAQYYEVAEKLTTNRLSGCSPLVHINHRFLLCMHAFLQNKTNECSILTRECIESAKAEDLMRLHVLSLLLFSTVVPLTVEAIKPMLEWIMKSHDQTLTVWSNRCICNILNKQGIDASVFEENARKARAIQSRDALLVEHAKNPCASLIKWVSGDPSSFIHEEMDRTG